MPSIWSSTNQTQQTIVRSQESEIRVPLSGSGPTYLVSNSGTRKAVVNMIPLQLLETAVPHSLKDDYLTQSSRRPWLYGDRVPLCRHKNLSVGESNPAFARTHSE